MVSTCVKLDARLLRNNLNILNHSNIFRGLQSAQMRASVWHPRDTSLDESACDVLLEVTSRVPTTVHSGFLLVGSLSPTSCALQLCRKVATSPSITTISE